MSVTFLQRNGLPALAYKKQQGALPTVVFLHGLRSDMEGTKAAYLGEFCAKAGQAFLRFDCSGHGVSEGDFMDGTIGDWKRDALDVIDNLTGGPLILVGSSMGGWLSFLCAMERPERVAGLIGLAAAPDFTRAIKAELTPDHKAALEQDGYFNAYESADFTLPITQKLLEEGEAHCILSAPVNIQCPVRLIQGMKDADVPWQTAHRIANALTGEDKQVYLREDGDHRLSADGDLDLLENLVAELSGRAV